MSKQVHQTATEESKIFLDEVGQSGGGNCYSAVYQHPQNVRLGSQKMGSQINRFHYKAWHYSFDCVVKRLPPLQNDNLSKCVT